MKDKIIVQAELKDTLKTHDCWFHKYYSFQIEKRQMLPLDLTTFCG